MNISHNSKDHNCGSVSHTEAQFCSLSYPCLLGLLRLLGRFKSFSISAGTGTGFSGTVGKKELAKSLCLLFTIL